MQRLKTRAQFQAALAGGVVAKTAHFALHRVQLDGKTAMPLTGAATTQLAKPWLSQPLFSVNDIWLGAMTPKRWAKRAVTRNTIRRQIYNVSIAFLPHLRQAAHVVRLRAAFDRSQFVSANSAALRCAAQAELQQLFVKLIERESQA